MSETYGPKFRPEISIELKPPFVVFPVKLAENGRPELAKRRALSYNTGGG
jgi:hypothetical protein